MLEQVRGLLQRSGVTAGGCLAGEAGVPELDVAQPRHFLAFGVDGHLVAQHRVSDAGGVRDGVVPGEVFRVGLAGGGAAVGDLGPAGVGGAAGERGALGAGGFQVVRAALLAGPAGRRARWAVQT